MSKVKKIKSIIDYMNKSISICKKHNLNIDQFNLKLIENWDKKDINYNLKDINYSVKYYKTVYEKLKYIDDLKNLIDDVKHNNQEQ